MANVITRNAPTPYNGCTVYGPIFHKGEGRYYVCILWSRDKRTTITYAKYLLSIYLGRRLSRYEEVDHIDNNKTNDTINNLQILTREENTKKGRELKTMIKCVCTRCHKIFYRRKGTEPGTNGRKSFCTRTCATKNQFSK